MTRSTLARVAALALVGMLAAGAPLAFAKPLQVGLIPSKDDNKYWDPGKQHETEIMNVAARAFADSRRFVVIEREKLKAIFTERDLQDFIKGTPGDMSTLETIDMLGIVTYSVEEEKDKSEKLFFIDVRLVEVKTGRVAANLTSRRVTVLEPSSPMLAGKNLLGNIREGFPPEGVVLSVEDEVVVIDVGTESGLRKGDKLNVLRDGEVLIHPIDNRPIQGPDVLVGTLEVLEPAAQLSTCRLKKSSKEEGPVVVADRVRLVPKFEKAQELGSKIPFLTRVRDVVKKNTKDDED